MVPPFDKEYVHLHQTITKKDNMHPIARINYERIVTLRGRPLRCRLRFYIQSALSQPTFGAVRKTPWIELLKEIGGAVWETVLPFLYKQPPQII